MPPSKDWNERFYPELHRSYGTRLLLAVVLALIVFAATAITVIVGSTDSSSGRITLKMPGYLAMGLACVFGVVVIYWEWRRLKRRKV